MVIHVLSINSFACTKLEDLKMHLAVSVFHLSGGKDEREGPAAVKRILGEHRGAKGKLLEHALNLCMHAQLCMCPCLNVKGRGGKRGSGCVSGFHSGPGVEEQDTHGKPLRSQQ